MIAMKTDVKFGELPKKVQLGIKKAIVVPNRDRFEDADELMEGLELVMIVWFAGETLYLFDGGVDGNAHVMQRDGEDCYVLTAGKASR